MKHSDLSKVPYPEAEKYFSYNDIVVLPVGSTEQHGKHNPLGTDYLIAYRLALEAAKQTGVATLPPVPFGVSSHHRHFPGTIYVSEESFRNYIKDICLSLKEHGVRKIVIVNGHGGNLASLLEVARKLKQQGLLIVVFQWWNLRELSEYFKPEERGHAAAMETSLIAFLYPDLVDLTKTCDEEPREVFKGLPVYYPGDTKEYTDSGVFGLSSTASSERGKIVFEIVAKKLIEIIEVLKKIDVKDVCSKA